MEEIFKDEQHLTIPTFEELRNDEQFTDVVIVTNDGTKFSCHKIILTAGCPFFRGLFRSEIVETRQNEIHLKEIDIAGIYFNQILKFIYTGEITLNVENAKVISKYAGLFAMENLKKASENFLIKSITNETCLELWRHSDKYFCDNLKKLCLIAASTEVFLEAHIKCLTLEEIKSLASFQERNCTSKIILENVIKWLKIDFQNRQQFITDLMELINFDDIPDKEFKNQIDDEILMQNKEFLALTLKYLIRQNAQNVINVSKKKLFVVTSPNILYTHFAISASRSDKINNTQDNIIYQYQNHQQHQQQPQQQQQQQQHFGDNSSQKFYIHPKTLVGLTAVLAFIQIMPRVSNLRCFGISHTTNGFLITGGSKARVSFKSCTLYCPITKTERDFPALIEARAFHANYTLGNKIYACGGDETNTVEVFDEISEKWVYGPAMNVTRLQDFGSADDNVNNLYTVSGMLDEERKSDLISHLDTRTKSWEIIYRDPSIQSGYTRSVYKDNTIYSFGDDEGFIFDIRAQKMLSTVPYNFEDSESFDFSSIYFDCTIVDDDIWLLDLAGNNVVDAIKLNLKTNLWERQMFKNDLQFTTFKGGELSLVWCN